MKPKTIIPKAVKEVDNITVQSTDDLVKDKLDDHINNKDIHVDKNIKDNISYLRKDLDTHLLNDNIHVSLEEKNIWNSKETTYGAQSKANKVLASLDAHKADYNIHITQLEKETFRDKYTRAEVRNLVKHTLIGLKFLPAVTSRNEIDTKYPKPEFNSTIFVRDSNITLVFNGEQWVEFNALFTPEITEELDGLMTNDDKIKLDGIEIGANKYIHPDNVDTRHVTDAQIDYWNKKADNSLVSISQDGLMSSADKTKLDTIESNANNYTHPENHDASMITQDATHRFVTDEEKTAWNAKTDKEYVDSNIEKTLSSAKSFTDYKLASMFNSSEAQLEVLRSLTFELKKDDTVKQFFDLYNECAKNTELQEHTINSKIHMSIADRNLLNDVKEAFTNGINPDWNEDDPSSLSYINNKPKYLLANGGNADTVGGYSAQELLTNKSFYDYTIGTSEYTENEVSILTDDTTTSVDNVVNLINKGKGYSVLFRPGSFSIEKELVIKASNITITGIGNISKLLGASIKIVGNNNTIENITLINGKDSIVNQTAIYVEGNNNIIRSNTIANYNEGIIVEGTNNIIVNNNIANIRNSAIRLVSDLNSNYSNTIESNIIRSSNIGINLLSSKNYLYRNYIMKNSVFNCNIGIVLSNSVNDNSKTINNIISENIVIRGRGESSEYLENHKTIVSEFSSKNIISSNITSGKEIIAPDNILTNNIF